MDSGPTGSRRRAALVLQLLGAILVLSAVIVGLTGSHASAATLSNGTVEIQMSSGGSVATSPLQNHATVNVLVGSNSTLNRSALQTAGFPSGTAPPIKVLECADPSGSAANLPKKSTDCDPTTIFSSTTVQDNGSVYASKYTIYALPDIEELGPSNGTVCDASHECVLGIFTDQNDFTKPHLFSAPFAVSATDAAATGASGTSSTGSTSPGASTASGASAAVSVTPATLANTGGPTWWPWMLGVGLVLLVVGSTLRYLRRPASDLGGSR
jgi:hypothetical protein